MIFTIPVSENSILELNDRVHIKDIRRSDLHMHTSFCDGKDTPEDMVLSAIEKGMKCIGFSGHSFTEFDLSCGMDKKTETAYIKEIFFLRSKYRGIIDIFCGIEQDLFSPAPDAQYDYVIGSVHYIKVPGGYVAVDDMPRILKDAAGEHFGGDALLMAERYFETVVLMAGTLHPDVIGHFDLISKFNEKEHLFDEHHPRYIAAWQKALDAILPLGIVFEINTGGISRGWRSVPYPSPDMMEYIISRGGRFILSSDSHSKENIGFGFS